MKKLYNIREITIEKKSETRWLTNTPEITISPTWAKKPLLATLFDLNEGEETIAILKFKIFKDFGARYDLVLVNQASEQTKQTELNALISAFDNAFKGM